MAISQDIGKAVRESVVSRAQQQIDEREKASIERFLLEFDTLSAPFDEDSAITHVTGSAIVVSDRGLLLHLHKRANIWIQPGGHVDPGEAPWQGAIRETLEETGIEGHHPNGAPLLVHVDVHDAPKGHVHLDLRYLLLASGKEPAPPTGESQQVEWVNWSDDRLNRESLQGAVASARRVADKLGLFIQ